MTLFRRKAKWVGTAEEVRALTDAALSRIAAVCTDTGERHDLLLLVRAEVAIRRVEVALAKLPADALNPTSLTVMETNP